MKKMPFLLVLRLPIWRRRSVSIVALVSRA